MLKPMKLPDMLSRIFREPRLTRTRAVLALAVAVVADGLQLLLGPLGWLFVDEIIDVAAMGLSCALIGFHWLLLPTFVVEFVPVADMLPTWTGCVSTVLVLRRKARRATLGVPAEAPPNRVDSGG